MAGISPYKILMIRRKRSNATEFFFVSFENVILAEMQIIKKTRLYGALNVLTLDHQEFEIIGTLDFDPAMFFFCKYHFVG